MWGSFVMAETLYALFELPFWGSGVGKNNVIVFLEDVASSPRVRIRQQANSFVHKDSFLEQDEKGYEFQMHWCRSSNKPYLVTYTHIAGIHLIPFSADAFRHTLLEHTVSILLDTECIILFRTGMHC